MNFKIVKVECPLDELEKREIARGDREIGLAKFQYENIHDGVIYDLNLNTLVNSPEQCAQQVIESLA